ncbi:hypothetical protein M9458_007048, partial [Cirrhinus mrigala]
QLSLVDEAREREGLDEKPCPLHHCCGFHKSPPTHPLPPHPVILASSALPALIPVSPSAHPQPTICAVGSLRDPLSLPWPVNPVAPPWLLASSPPPWSVCPPALLGSLIPPTLLWSVVNHPPPRDSTSLATPYPSGFIRLLLPSGSTLVLCRSGSTLARRILCVTLAHQLSISTIFHLFHCCRPSSTMALSSLFAMNHFTAVNLLCLKQGNRSLKEHLKHVFARRTEHHHTCTVEPRPPSPFYAELEPSTDREPKPTVTDEPSPERATEPRIVPEPEPDLSDLVRQPAT